MVNRDDVINSLSRKYDPRAARWEYRAILDVLQEVEPITVKDLVEAINEKYEWSGRISWLAGTVRWIVLSSNS